MLLADMRTTDVANLSRETPVLIPIAAIEQHGPHLPLDTDARLLAHLVDRIERARGSRCLIAPLQWLGNSHHHLDFPGTLSAPPDIYLSILRGLVACFLEHGFRRLLVINGHGGNDVPGKQALFQVRQEFRHRTDLLLLFATYWSLASSPPQEVIPDLHQPNMGHACEWETSMMIHIDAAAVGEYESLPEVNPGQGFRPAVRSWVTKERSASGYLGSPHRATQRKGERLIELFTGGITHLVDRMADWDGRSWDG